MRIQVVIKVKLLCHKRAFEKPANLADIIVGWMDWAVVGRTRKMWRFCTGYHLHKIKLFIS